MQVPPGFTLHILEEAGSTNDICLALADAGAPDGTVVFAHHQTAGKGRQGREWFSRPGSSLTFSLLLRLSIYELDLLSRFSLLGSSAMVDVLARYYQLQGLIKWPNDVIVHGKKICGVLMEANWRGQALQAVILGMGVNLARDAYPPEAALRYPATSLEAETGFAPQPLELLENLLIMLLNKQTLRALKTPAAQAGQVLPAIENIVNGAADPYAYADSAEHREGIGAFLSKRPPVF